jgi:chromosomal replication initiation ATPase DnaA
MKFVPAIEKLSNNSSTIAQLVDAVCATFRVEARFVLSDNRSGAVAIARQVVYYLARKHTRYTLTQLGEMLGRNHSTIACGVRRVQETIEEKRRIGGFVNGEHFSLLVDCAKAVWLDGAEPPSENEVVMK